MADYTTRRILGKGISGFWIGIAILVVGTQAFAQGALQKVTLSYSSSGITSIEFFIAKEKKFFQEEGLEPLLIQMSANTAIAAGVTGELSGLSSIGSAIRAIQRGAPGLAARRLDLDDVGAEPGQHLRGAGPGLLLGEIENANPVERLGHGRKLSDAQSNIRTVRATSPAFIARKASLTSSRRPRRVIISSSFSRPCRYSST